MREAKDHISGLRENVIKRYIVEKTSKAEIRPEEQSEEAGSRRENLWNETQLKGPCRQKQTQEQNKKGWASSVGLRQRHTSQHSLHVKVSPRGLTSWRVTRSKARLGCDDLTLGHSS